MREQVSVSDYGTRTADIASVLRMPGTRNYKYTPSREVRLTRAKAPLGQADFLKAVCDAHDRLCGEFAGSVTAPVIAASGDAALAPPSPIAPNLLRLEPALRYLDPDCDESTWKLKRLAPMAKAAREHPGLAVDIKDLARRWSSGELQDTPSSAWVTPGASNGLTGESAFDGEWNRFVTDRYAGKPVTFTWTNTWRVGV